MKSLDAISGAQWNHEPARSADRQSAVSRIGNPQTLPVASTLPTASRRNSRLPTCATRFMESAAAYFDAHWDLEPQKDWGADIPVGLWRPDALSGQECPRSVGRFMGSRVLAGTMQSQGSARALACGDWRPRQPLLRRATRHRSVIALRPPPTGEAPVGGGRVCSPIPTASFRLRQASNGSFALGLAQRHG